MGALRLGRHPQGGAQKSRAKKEAQLLACKFGGLRADLQGVADAHLGAEVRVWSQDESRFGLLTVQRRRLTLPGVKPVCPFQHAFESFWLCGAVEPASGRSFVLELPSLRTDCLQLFLDEFAAAHARDPQEVHVLLLDNGGAHHAKALRWPARVVPLFLPAYCPELNPIERWWRELKDSVANTLFDTLEDLRKRLDAQLHAWRDDPARLTSLSSYPYLCCALEMLDQP